MDDNFQDWIGKSVARDDVLTPRIAGSFRAALAPHLHDSPCPPGLHWCLAPALPGTEELGEDGTETGGGFLPPLALARRMWAGGRIETLRPFAIGMAVTRTSVIAEIKMRQGKSGPLCFMSITHAFADGDGLVLRERQDLVFREPNAMGAITAPPRLPPAGELVWRVDASPLLLFRFSALTFNSHRIHYDLPYARDVESHAGLLVQGQLQAALLLNQFAVLNGTVPRVFDYRCVAPLVAGGKVTVASRRSGGGFAGEIADSQGKVTTEATSTG